jgi:hypothetical protein
MKTLKYFALMSILLLSLITLSCSQDDNIDANSNNLNTGQIELKSYSNTDKVISFGATVKKITINWGDGSIDELTPGGIGQRFTHEYNGQNLQTISINTEDLTSISLDTKNHKELRIGNCPSLIGLNIGTYYSCDLTVLEINKAESLETLKCNDNQLTSLYLGECASLKKVNCSGNYLDELTLNALFKNLPVIANEDAVIYIGNNPGAYNCDKTIATKKGWTFK